MSPRCGEYSDRLLWYVAGRTTAGESLEMERHLAFCRDCAMEATALRSMMRSIREEPPADHVPSMEIIAYHDGDLPASGDRAREIRDHLETCEECAADLGSLRKAESRERRLAAASEAGAQPAANRRRRFRWLPLAAAGILVLAGAAAWGVSRSFSPSLAPRAGDIVFAPAKRGATAARRLQGHGPWTVRVLLPIEAPRTAVHARIDRAEGGSERIFDADLTPDRDGSVLIVVPDLEQPGHHVLSLQPVGIEGGDDLYVYAFDVVGSR